MMPKKSTANDVAEVTEVAVAEKEQPIEFAIAELSIDGKISLIASSIRDIMPELEDKIRDRAKVQEGTGAHDHVEHARLHRLHLILSEALAGLPA
jgi:hypothetical protein